MSTKSDTAPKAEAGPNKPTRKRGAPRSTAERLADMAEFLDRIGADAYMAGDEAKAKRAKDAKAALLAIETPPEAQGRV